MKKQVLKKYDQVIIDVLRVQGGPTERLLKPLSLNMTIRACRAWPQAQPWDVWPQNRWSIEKIEKLEVEKIQASGGKGAMVEAEQIGPVLEHDCVVYMVATRM